MPLIFRLRWPLILTLAASGAVVAARAAIGPYYLPLIGWVRSPLVGAGVCALAATLLLLMNDGKPELPSKSARHTAALAAVLILTAGLLAPMLWFPLVCDEYVLAAQANAMDWEQAAASFTHAGIDGFFRPLADVTLRFDAAWSGLNPTGWHVLGLVLHLLNTALVYFLAWRILRRPAAAFWAAALYGIHGARPEAVAFLARFDQLATLFLLCGLILFDRYLESSRPAPLVAGYVAMLAGLLSKESAYVFPLLAIWLLALRGRYKQIRVTIGFFALTAIAFVYRWRVLGGIGGYADRTTGRPEILNIHPVSLLKGFTLRLWGLLYFPINWSYRPEPWLAAALILAIGAVLCVVFLARPDRRNLAFAAAFVLIASVPVAHMLLIGADLRGAAHLYLPSIGFCIFLAAAIDSVPRRGVATAAGAALLLFHLTALAHNMLIWDRTAHLADDVCRMAAREAVQASQAPIFEDPPRILDGIAFFANGLPECVGMHARGARVNVVFGPDMPDAPTGVPVFVWNEGARRFDPK